MLPLAVMGTMAWLPVKEDGPRPVVAERRIFRRWWLSIWKYQKTDWTIVINGTPGKALTLMAAGRLAPHPVDETVKVGLTGTNGHRRNHSWLETAAMQRLDEAQLPPLDGLRLIRCCHAQILRRSWNDRSCVYSYRITGIRYAARCGIGKGKCSWNLQLPL